MFKTLKRIADALEASNKREIETYDDESYWYLKSVLEKQASISEKLVDKVSDLRWKFWCIELTPWRTLSVNWDWHICTIDISIDECYFSWKHCVQTDKERVEVLVVFQDWTTKHTQALESHLPKDVHKHFNQVIYFDVKDLDGEEKS